MRTDESCAYSAVRQPRRCFAALLYFLLPVNCLLFRRHRGNLTTLRDASRSDEHNNKNSDDNQGKYHRIVLSQFFDLHPSDQRKNIARDGVLQRLKDDKP